MNCVYRASSVEQADIVVAWLADQDVAAFVKDRNMAANYIGLAVAPQGIEVCVTDPEEAATAEALLTEHQASLKPKTGQSHDKMITVQCSECGRNVQFPSELLGTVQTCPSCRRNVDVGDPPQFC